MYFLHASKTLMNQKLKRTIHFFNIAFICSCLTLRLSFFFLLAQKNKISTNNQFQLKLVSFMISKDKLASFNRKRWTNVIFLHISTHLCIQGWASIPQNVPPFVMVPQFKNATKLLDVHISFNFNFFLPKWIQNI